MVLSIRAHSFILLPLTENYALARYHYHRDDSCPNRLTNPTGTPWLQDQDWPCPIWHFNTDHIRPLCYGRRVLQFKPNNVCGRIACHGFTLGVINSATDTIQIK